MGDKRNGENGKESLRKIRKGRKILSIDLCRTDTMLGGGGRGWREEQEGVDTEVKGKKVGEERETDP